MTRWLEAARRSAGASTEPTKPTETAREPVLSVKSVLSEAEGASHGPPAESGPGGDARAYVDCLLRLGPLTYGAAAMKLGWGVTRAWQAQNCLRLAGAVTLDELGRANLTAGIQTDTDQSTVDKTGK